MYVVTTCGAFGAVADVRILSVLAGASIPARLTQTLVNIGLAQPAGVSGSAVAAEGGQAVDARTVMAGIWVTLIDVCLTVPPSVTWQKC